MENKTQIIEIYGKEINKDGRKFIVCSAKLKDGSYANVRFTQEANYKPTKGKHKVEIDLTKSNTKQEKGKDGKNYTVIYVKKCKEIEYTEEEKAKMQQKQAEDVANLFN